MTAPRPASNLRYDINGLRPSAVPAVVLFHFDVPGFTGGFVGVDKFFVISGFLMTDIIIGGLDGSAGLSALIVALFPIQIVALVAQPKLQPYLWLLPLRIRISSSYAAQQFWRTQKKRLSIIVKTRMQQTLGGAVTQVDLGWTGIAPLGLLLGQMINSGAGIFGLMRAALKNNHAATHAVNWKGMQRIFSEYSRCPKYSTFDALANSANIHLPVIIISALAAGPEAGFLMFCIIFSLVLLIIYRNFI